jgi:hypothetical protein
MRLDHITLVLAVDRIHLQELRWTWPTWMHFKPELREMPAIVFYDSNQIDPAEASFLEQHPRLRFVPWTWPFGRDQREKMITGWLHIPAREVNTPWYLKLDTDTTAIAPGDWIKQEWFNPGPDGQPPVFISSKWVYSKPRHVMDLLDDWGDKVPQLSKFPRLNLAYSSESRVLRHRRIISWLFFGNTQWTREAVSWLGPDGRLPHASQDTFLFYCAKRSRKWFVRERMNKYGWCHKPMPMTRRLVNALGFKPQI